MPDAFRAVCRDMGGVDEFIKRVARRTADSMELRPSEELLLLQSIERVEFLERSDVPAYQAVLVCRYAGRAGLVPLPLGESDRHASVLDWGWWAALADGSAQVRLDRTGVILRLPRRPLEHQAG